MKSTHKALVLILTCLVSIAFDQWTKLLAVEHLKGTFPRHYVGGLAKLLYAENTGAWGNLGGSWPEPLRFAFLILVPVAVLLGIGIYVVFSKKVKLNELFALSFIISGGAGNLIDRINLGYVVDFMYVGYKSLGTNIFNVADVVIMLGFFMLLIQNIIEWKNKKKSSSLATESQK